MYFNVNTVTGANALNAVSCKTFSSRRTNQSRVDQNVSPGLSVSPEGQTGAGIQPRGGNCEWESIFGLRECLFFHIAFKTFPTKVFLSSSKCTESVLLAITKSGVTLITVLVIFKKRVRIFRYESALRSQIMILMEFFFQSFTLGSIVSVWFV